MAERANTDPNNFRKKRLIRNRLIGALFVVSVLVITLTYLLPYLMSSPNKPGGSHMYIGYVGSMNRAQQAYYLDHEKFASSLEDLNLSIDPEAKNYIFFTVNFRQAAFNYGIPAGAYNYEPQTKTWRRAYIGGVFLTKVPGTNELTTEAIICRAEVSGVRAIEPPINAQTCGSKTSKIFP